MWLIVILGALTAVGIWVGYTKSMRKQQAEIDRGKECGWFDEGAGGGGPEELRQLNNEYRHLREGRKKAVWVTLGVTAALLAAASFLLSTQQNAREDAYVEGWNKGWSEMCKYLFTSYPISGEYELYGPPQGSYDYCLASAPYDDIVKSRAAANAPTWGDAAGARSWGEDDAADEVWEQFVTAR